MLCIAVLDVLELLGTTISHLTHLQVKILTYFDGFLHILENRLFEVSEAVVRIHVNGVLSVIGHGVLAIKQCLRTCLSQYLMVLII